MTVMLNDLPQVDESMMDRRVFAGLAVSSLLGLPLIAMAQQMGKTSRIGVLLPWNGPTPEDSAYIESERPRYRALGWVEGQNLFVERRWAGTDPRRWREIIAEFKALRLALIVTFGTAAIRAARDGAPGVPIVMVSAGDPVGAGFVRSLAQPGGSLTGTSAAGAEVLAKQLELLSLSAPRAKRVTVLMAGANPANRYFFGALSAAAKRLGVQLERLDETQAEELDAAISRAKGGALLVMGDPLFSLHYARIAEQALRANVPTALPDPAYVRAGGLLSFAAPPLWHWHKAASYIDKILRGAKPGDLPVEQPTQFEMAINMKTAKALGLVIPPAMLLQATEVIE